MDSMDYVLDGELAFSDSKQALKFYQKKYHEQQSEIQFLKDLIKKLTNEKGN